SLPERGLAPRRGVAREEDRSCEYYGLHAPPFERPFSHDARRAQLPGRGRALLAARGALADGRADAAVLPHGRHVARGADARRGSYAFRLAELVGGRVVHRRIPDRTNLGGELVRARRESQDRLRRPPLRGVPERAPAGGGGQFFGGR